MNHCSVWAILVAVAVGAAVSSSPPLLLLQIIPFVLSFILRLLSFKHGELMFKSNHKNKELKEVSHLLSPSSLTFLSLLSLLFSGTYPIKLFYTSNLPLVMYAVVTGNLFMISQVSQPVQSDNQPLPHTVSHTHCLC